MRRCTQTRFLLLRIRSRRFFSLQTVPDAIGHAAGGPETSDETVPIIAAIISAHPIASLPPRFQFWTAMPKPARLLVLKRSDDAINCCAWHPNQKTIAVGADDGRVTLYDATKGRELRGSVQRKAAVSTVAFAFDGSLAVGGADGHVAIYDKRGKLQRKLRRTRASAVAPSRRRRGRFVSGAKVVCT